MKESYNVPIQGNIPEITTLMVKAIEAGTRMGMANKHGNPTEESRRHYKVYSSLMDKLNEEQKITVRNLLNQQFPK